VAQRTSSAPAESRLVQLAPGLAGVLILAILLVLARNVASILLLFFLAVLLAVYLDAVRDLLHQRLRIPERLAFAGAALVTGFLIWALWALLVPPVVEQTRLLISRLPEIAANWKVQLAALVERYPFLDPYIGPDHQAELIQSALSEAEGFLSGLLPKVFDLMHGMINIVSVLVMGIFLALHPDEYEGMVVAVTPPAYRGATKDVLGALSRTLKSWVMSQILVMTTLGGLTAILFWFVGVPYWLTFGIFAGVAAMVPFFGTLISTVAPALFVLGGPNGVQQALIVTAIGVVVHLVEANLVAPLIMKRGVHLPPVFSIMAVLIVGKLMGPVGLLVAVPLLAVLMVLVRKILIQRVYGDTQPR
jgi:predicted PurR-regulated permease PerM